jgi:hypothetical protein
MKLYLYINENKEINLLKGVYTLINAKIILNKKELDLIQKVILNKFKDKEKLIKAGLYSVEVDNLLNFLNLKLLDKNYKHSIEYIKNISKDNYIKCLKILSKYNVINYYSESNNLNYFIVNDCTKISSEDKVKLMQLNLTFDIFTNSFVYKNEN